MNSLSSSERIMQEYKDLVLCPLSEMGLTVGLPEENNIYRWKVLFYYEIKIPKLYPEEVPKFVFINPIYHPNVNMKKSTDNLELGQVAFKAIINWKSANKIKAAAM